MRIRIRKISAALLSFIVALAFCGFAGCSWLFDVGVESVSFVIDGKTVSSAEMKLGERLDLSRIVNVLPLNASDRGFTVESSDESVVAIEKKSTSSVTRVYAVAAGVGNSVVTVTASDKKHKASLNVTVGYALPDSVEISVCGDVLLIRDTVVISSGEISTVVMTARAGENADPDTVVVWSVDGVRDKETKCGEDYAFTPTGIGHYGISAAVSGGDGKTYYDTLSVNVYDDVAGAKIGYTGKLEQEYSSLTRVVFDMAYDALPEGNPEPIAEWYVNGAVNGYGESFSFLPSAPGVYEVEGRLNGVPVGKETLKVSGTVYVDNVTVDFDNCYPKVMIRWDPAPMAAGYKISVVDNATGREVSEDISTDNIAIRDKFTESGFDASDYLSDKLFTDTYTVKVKTLASSDGVLDESPWSRPYSTSLVPVKAKPYLADKFYDGARNAYITGFDEFYEWFEYAMLWRPSGLSSGVKLYLDYAFTSASDEIEAAMNAQHFTGQYSYSGLSSRFDRKECTFRIIFETDGNPSTRTSGTHSGESWNALRPHVNYDESKARPAKYVFPIDRKTPVTVETGEQLYYMAQRGYNPVPAAGSVAERLNNYARRTLRYIITDDMTDAEKLHAIYDWIMWRVKYDHEVLDITDIASAVRYESYYLESVLSDGNNYGVCDAMSKAFALMSSIEGFECMRVTGVAGVGTNKGGHAWNKVKLDGKWYIVDCTWGDASVQIMAGGSYRESAGHAYFLVTDGNVADTHREDYNRDFPATASERYPWYENGIDYGGEKLDVYLDGEMTSAQFGAEIDKLTESMIITKSAAERIYRVGFDNVNRTATVYYAFEIVSSSRWGKAPASVLRTEIDRSHRKRGLAAGTDYYVSVSSLDGLVYTQIYYKL